MLIPAHVGSHASHTGASHFDSWCAILRSDGLFKSEVATPVLLARVSGQRDIPDVARSDDGNLQSRPSRFRSTFGG